MAGLGAAQPDWLHFYTLELMHEAGGNFIRWGHCVSGPGMADATDRLGMVVEEPGVDGESGHARGGVGVAHGGVARCADLLSQSSFDCDLGGAATRKFRATMVTEVARAGGKI